MAPGACTVLPSMTRKRFPAGTGHPGLRDNSRRSHAFTPGPHARKRSTTDWSVIGSYRTVKRPTTVRKDLSKPQYNHTTRKRCSGVFTFLARTKALHSRAMRPPSEGKSCHRSSHRGSGSVSGNCLVCFSWTEIHFSPMQSATPFSRLTPYPGAYGCLTLLFVRAL